MMSLSQTYQFKGLANLPSRVQKKVHQEISLLKNFAAGSEASLLQTRYIEELTSFPWQDNPLSPTPPFDIKQKIEAPFFGHENTKRALVEWLSTSEPFENGGSVPCLSGPSGTGKTSLVTHIAKALQLRLVILDCAALENRSFAGFSRVAPHLGPGIIAQILSESQSSPCVVLLKGIDKFPSAHRESRLHELKKLLCCLGGKTGLEFHDEYYELPLNIRSLRFVMTTSDDAEIPHLLQDKLSVYAMPGYFAEEKQTILKDYLLPRLLVNAGIRNSAFTLDARTMECLVHEYSREAGLKNMERFLQRLIHSYQKQYSDSGNPIPDIAYPWITSVLGTPPFQRVTSPPKLPVGTGLGLAHSSLGGELFTVECKLLSGNGRLQATGNLGKVMVESFKLATVLVKERLQKFGIEPALVRKTDIIIHVPAASLPKEGPSAGLTFVMVLLSRFLKKPLPTGCAFSGEITLSGRVRGVGGIFQKIIAAQQNNLKKMYLPEENLKELKDIPPTIKKQIDIITVKHIDEVIQNCLHP